MDVIRAILDGIAIAAIFNGAVAAWVLINPRYFFDSYPKAIQKSAPEQMTKKEKKINLGSGVSRREVNCILKTSCII